MQAYILYPGTLWTFNKDYLTGLGLQLLIISIINETVNGPWPPVSLQKCALDKAS